MQISVHEQPDAAVAQEVGAWLDSGGAGEAALFEHDPRWLDVLREGLSHQPIVLLAREDEASPTSAGAISGYLPLALVSSRLFGRYLVSLPYLNRAGVVANDAATADALLQKAAWLAGRYRVQYLELRHDRPLEHESLTRNCDEKVRMVLDLPADEQGLAQAIGSKVRNQVRKADQASLTLRWGGEELLSPFYEVLAVNMRDLGTPVYPRRLFASILGRFEAEAELAVVWQGSKAIAGALLLHDRRGRVTQVPTASCLRAYNRTNANMWLYYHLLLRAIMRGAGQFDFGRSSKDSGTYRFKKQWGAQPRPTVWQYGLAHEQVERLRPEHPRYQRGVAMWKRLPVWVTRLVGPSIVRGIP